MNVVAGEIKDILDAPELERAEIATADVSSFLLLEWIILPFPMRIAKSLQ